MVSLKMHFIEVLSKVMYSNSQLFFNEQSVVSDDVITFIKVHELVQ